jgi:hypothetical protein
MFEQYETGTLDEILLMIEEKKIVIKWEFVVGFYK